MAKALKFAALAIGAVALIATGVGAVALGGLAGTLTVAGVSAQALFLASAGLSVAASLLQKAPKVPTSQTDRLTATIDPRAFRKTVLGQTAMATDVRYEEWAGNDQEYCNWIVALASHAIDGVEEIWLNTDLAWSATTGVVGKYKNYFFVPHIITEGTPANAFGFDSMKWNAASARLTGCAYAHLRFKVTGNSKKAESPFSGGIPSRITIIGRGAKLYDPRRDSTVPGGSGPMRWNDQTTWRYTTDDGAVIGENLPLQILRVLLGWRIKNPVTSELKLATGSGLPGKRIDFLAFQAAANLADELVNRSAGGTEPRYHGASVVSEGDDPKTILDMLCAACCGRFRDTGGKLSLVIGHNDLAAAATDDGLNDDDVVGGFTWDPDPALEAAPNVVRGKYVDPTTNSLYQMIDYPEVRLPSPDGQDRIFALDLGAVESPSHAQRIAKQVLQRKQYLREFTAPFDIRAWKYGVGDVVPFTFAALSFTRVLFRVKEQELGQGGTCNMVLSFETPEFYLWDASDAPAVVAADPIVYDASKNPLILAITDAAGTADWSGVTGPGKPADNADVTGDNISKDTQYVNGRSAAQLIQDMDIDVQGTLANALRQDDYQQTTDARTFVNGQPVNSYVLEFRNQQTAANSAISSTLSLIGAKAPDGTGWVLNLNTVQVGNGQTLAERLDEVGVSNGAVTATIQSLQQITADLRGKVNASVTLNLTTNGYVSGYRLTNDGTVSTMTVVADQFAIVSDNNGTPIIPMRILGGTVYMDRLVAGSITYAALEQRFTDVGQQNLDPGGWYQVLPGGMIMQGGRVRRTITDEVLVPLTFPRPFPNQVLAVGAIPFLNARTDYGDLWMQNVGEPTKTGANFATQAATKNDQRLDGFDWWAWGK